MSGVVWLLLLTVLAGGASWVAGEWRRVQGGIWLALVLFMGWALGTWPADRPVWVLGVPVTMGEPLQLFGISFILDERARGALRLLGWGIGTWGIAALAVPTWGRGIGWLAPGVAMFVLASTVQEMWALGIMWALWALAALWVTYGGWPGGGHPAWQWWLPFLAMALGLTTLLIWPDPNEEAVAPWRVSVVMVALVLVSGLAPLHVGLAHLGQMGRALGSVWTWWAHSIMLLVLIGRVGADPALRVALEPTWTVVRFLVALTWVWTGLAALTASDLGRLAGQAAVYNTTLMWTLWIAVPGEEARILWALAVRWLGLFTMGLALALLTPPDGTRALDAVAGWARRRPWTGAAWTIGVATLGGVPFTAGGWLLWALRDIALGQDWSLSLALAGSLAVTVGLIRSVIALWGRLEDPLLPREAGWSKMMVVLISWGGIGLGLVPQWLARVTQWMR